MSYFKSFKDLIYYNPNPKQNETPEGAFTGMKEEDIAETATIFSDENKALKQRLLSSEKENKRLKEVLTGSKSNDTQSYSSFIFDSLKSALELDDSVDKETKQNTFQSFLFNQLTFQGGLDEDDVYSLNHFSIKKEDNIEHNHEIFSFKQMIIERNYQELFRNMKASKEINKLIPKKPIKDNDMVNVITKINNNTDIKGNQSIETKGKSTDFEIIIKEDYMNPKNDQSKKRTDLNTNKENSNQTKVINKLNKKNTHKENQANILSGKYTSYLHDLL